MSNILTKLIVSLKSISRVGNATIIKAFNKLPHGTKITDDFNFIKNLGINRINTLISKHMFTKNDWSYYLQQADGYIQEVHDNNINIITFLSPEYPKSLKAIKTNRFPVILYVKGNVKLLNSKSIAIIGTRHPSSFGSNLAKRYATYFARQGYTDIGGLALGIDSDAHRATLNANGKVIAIMAASLDQPVSPRSHTALAKKILNSGGALVSEYPLGTRVQPRNYVTRDKWQSGISDGVLAIEAGMNSGTQHTMRDAKSQGKLLGAPDYEKYRYEFNQLNRPTNELPSSPGTQLFINNKQAIPLCTKASVITFTNTMKNQRKQYSKLVKKSQGSSNSKHNKSNDKGINKNKRSKRDAKQLSLFK